MSYDSELLDIQIVSLENYNSLSAHKDGEVVAGPGDTEDDVTRDLISQLLLRYENLKTELERTYLNSVMSKIEQS